MKSLLQTVRTAAENLFEMSAPVLFVAVVAAAAAGFVLLSIH